MVKLLAVGSDRLLATAAGDIKRRLHTLDTWEAFEHPSDGTHSGDFAACFTEIGREVAILREHDCPKVLVPYPHGRIDSGLLIDLHDNPRWEARIAGSVAIWTGLPPPVLSIDGTLYKVLVVDDTHPSVEARRGLKKRTEDLIIEAIRIVQPGSYESSPHVGNALVPLLQAYRNTVHGNKTAISRRAKQVLSLADSVTTAIQRQVAELVICPSNETNASMRHRLKQLKESKTTLRVLLKLISEISVFDQVAFSGKWAVGICTSSSHSRTAAFTICCECD